VPVDRLVDWVDQAHLYLRFSKDDGAHNGLSLFGLRRRSRLDNSRQKLRVLGIRSAIDLEDALKLPEGTSQTDQDKDQELIERLRWVLNMYKDKEPSVTESLVKTLRSEFNLYHVRHWKEFTANIQKHDSSEVQGKEGPAQFRLTNGHETEELTANSS
jgi:hypothetical protein